ncbi:MAG: YvcK family protein [Spartobacteria bacterium]|nr:YvcK family protein [Spartobacteria bacterium]
MHYRTAKKPNTTWRDIQDILEGVLNGGSARRDVLGVETLSRIRSFNPRETRVVVLGGGTGMSTVVGGNSQLAVWPEDPFDGLKSVFSRMDVVVCTTDDGGSTGKLVRQLPMIGIGDLRKSCLSLIRSENLLRAYRIDEQQVRDVIRIIHAVFNYRFPEGWNDRRTLCNPVLAVPRGLRQRCPSRLEQGLRELGRYIAPGHKGLAVRPGGHCLGNLLLTAAIFRAANGRMNRSPGIHALRKGLDHMARLIGVTPGHLHAATAVPGQLKFRYGNGVEVYGQCKAGTARRGFPVEWLAAEFAGAPTVSRQVLTRIAQADLIIYAPGSLYSSMIPLLQMEEVARTLRANTKALKILGANFWIQEGETDISFANAGRGYLVSELIEAYDRNIPGGTAGLFDVILAANLEHIPGSILRNYALEGKRPIHLDRESVEQSGLCVVEATLFSLNHLERPGVIHHDPHNFTEAVRTLLYAHEHLGSLKRPAGKSDKKTERKGLAFHVGGSPVLCDYIRMMEAGLADKRIQPASLRETMLDLCWKNRDIKPGHLAHFDAIKAVAADKWNRSTRWDNVLGYYDMEERCLKIHEKRLSDSLKLEGDLAVALGEAVLGQYITSRSWVKNRTISTHGASCYEIHLLAPAQRRTCLDDAQLRAYLKLARMAPDKKDPLVYRITLNAGEGFLPAGLLFGLLYAWYLDNRYGSSVEYEMSLLQWNKGELLPHQTKDRARRQALVDFFRTQVFNPDE